VWIPKRSATRFASTDAKSSNNHAPWAKHSGRTGVRTRSCSSVPPRVSIVRGVGPRRLGGHASGERTRDPCEPPRARREAVPLPDRNTRRNVETGPCSIPGAAVACCAVSRWRTEGRLETSSGTAHRACVSRPNQELHGADVVHRCWRSRGATAVEHEDTRASEPLPRVDTRRVPGRGSSVGRSVGGDLFGSSCRFRGTDGVPERQEDRVAR
jgi:hypothetical protein